MRTMMAQQFGRVVRYDMVRYMYEWKLMDVASGLRTKAKKITSAHTLLLILLSITH